jgi:hypothetical protein
MAKKSRTPNEVGKRKRAWIKGHKPVLASRNNRGTDGKRKRGKKRN